MIYRLHIQRSYSSNDTKGSITLSGLNDLAAGDYELDIVAQYESVTEIFSLQLNQRESSFEIPVLFSPLDEAEGESLTPELSWEPMLMQIILKFK